MTYQEKVDWLLSYRRQENKVQELEQEMKILEELADKKEAENPEFLSELKCQLIK